MRVAAAVLLVAVGALCHSLWHVGLPFAFGPALLYVFLPPLIFEAAWTIDLGELRRVAGIAAVLAIPGTLLSALAVTAVLVTIGALPFGSALVFAAIVCATDPIAVISVFRKTAVPRRITTLVEAESVANDGVAVVLYGFAIALAAGTATWGLLELLRGAGTMAGGAALGAVCAVPLWLALRRNVAPEHEVTATVVLAYVAYLLAGYLQLSGIFATATAAITLRALLDRRHHAGVRASVDAFWNAAAYIVNAIVFLSTGLLLDVPRALHEPLLVIAAIATVAASRACLCVLAARDLPARVTIFLAGMRGALPLALALALPADLAHRAEIIDGVFALVLVTLVLQGAPLDAVVRRLYGRAT